MANSVQILAKLARNAQMLGLSVVSQSQSAVVISNGSNNLSISYVLASIQSPMGGVDPTVSPYLGIGIANPGKLKLTSAINTNGNMSDVIDGQVAAQVLQMMSGMDNNIILSNSDGSYSVELRGDADLIGMGQ